MRYGLLLLLLACLSSTANAALVYQATLQDDAASTTVVAATGSNGTLLGGDNTADISEDVGPGGSYTKALHFDGTADGVDIGTDANFPDNAEERTICFWFRADSFSTDGSDAMVSYATTGGSAGTFFKINAEDQAVSVTFFSHTVITPKTTLAVDTWYHCAVVVPSGATTTADVEIYIDGVDQTLSDESGASQTLGTFSPDIFLARRHTAVDHYDGYLADIRVYDTDESANLATIMADGQDASGALLLQLQNGQ